MKIIQTFSLTILFCTLFLSSNAQLIAEIDGDLQLKDGTPALFLFDDAAGENRIEGALVENGDRIRLEARYGDLQLRTGVAGSTSTRLEIASTGQIGIGTSPAIDALLKLQVDGNERALHLVGNSSGTNDLAIRLSNSGGDHYIFDDADDAHALEFESANAIKFNTNGPNQRMEIDENGNIGMGISGSSTSRLRVAASTESYGTLAQAFGINANKYGIFGQSVNYASAFNYYGVYGRASTAGSNSWAGHFDGDLCYTGSLVAVSDRRVKENIKTMTPVLDRVMKLKPVQYTMKMNAYPGLNLAPGLQVGFISQDVESIFPDFVHDASHTIVNQTSESETSESDVVIKSLEYTSFIPVLTKAIQEQQILINQLTQRLELKEQEIKLLKNKKRLIDV